MLAREVTAKRTEESGISLTELIVAMLIFGIASTMVIGFFISTTKTMSLAQSLTTNTKQASNAMNQTARLIRAGTENPVKGETNDPAFLFASTETLTMYAYINLQSSEQKPIAVQLSLNTKRQLIEKQWPAKPGDVAGYWTFDVGGPPASTRILATSVAPTGSGGPLFSYLTADGSVLPAGSLNKDQRRSVAAVKVTLTLQEEGASDEHRVSLQNTVGIPNLGFHRVVS